MPGLMYFGNRERMTWVKCPDSGLGLGGSRYSAEGTFLNGGAYVHNSATGHRVYDMSWNFLRADEKDEIRAYLDGVYGSGLLYFLDPMAVRRNILPTCWATPGTAVDGAPSLVKSLTPSSGPALADPGNTRYNLIYDPRYTKTDNGISGGGTGTFSQAIVSSGAPDGRSYAQITVDSDATAAVQIGTTIYGLGEVVEGNDYTGSLYVRHSRAADVQANITWYDGSFQVLSQDFGAVVTTTANAWERLSVTAAAPVGAIAGQVRLYLPAASALTGDTVDVAMRMLEEGTVLGTYFDGNNPSSGNISYSWVGAQDGSASVEAVVGAYTPRTSAVYNVDSGSIFAELWLPVPEGHTLHVSGLYQPDSGDVRFALLSDQGVITEVPSDGSPVSVPGGQGYTLRLDGSGSLTANYLMAQVWPDGQGPDLSRFYPGVGHSGVRLSGDINDVGYSSPQALDFSALSMTLREVGSWE